MAAILCPGGYFNFREFVVVIMQQHGFRQQGSRNAAKLHNPVAAGGVGHTPASSVAHNAEVAYASYSFSNVEIPAIPPTNHVE